MEICDRSVLRQRRRRQADARWRASLSKCYTTLSYLMASKDRISKRISKIQILNKTSRHLLMLEYTVRDMLRIKAHISGCDPLLKWGLDVQHYRDHFLSIETFSLCQNFGAIASSSFLELYKSALRRESQLHILPLPGFHVSPSPQISSSLDVQELGNQPCEQLQTPVSASMNCSYGCNPPGKVQRRLKKRPRKGVRRRLLDIQLVDEEVISNATRTSANSSSVAEEEDALVPCDLSLSPFTGILPVPNSRVSLQELEMESFYPMELSGGFCKEEFDLQEPTLPSPHLNSDCQRAVHIVRLGNHPVEMDQTVPTSNTQQATQTQTESADRGLDISNLWTWCENIDFLQ